MHEQRVVALDGVRGLAALAVALPHYLMMQHWHERFCEAVSVVAVEVFFVLSGFVLAPQIIFCLSANARERLPVFFARRWMRTLPPYVLALSIMGILTGHLLDVEFFRHLFFVQNLLAIDDAKDFFAPAWSLSIEEWFYVIFPVYLILMRKSVENIKNAVGLFVVFFVATKVIGIVVGAEAFTVMRRLVIFRLDSICFGFLLFIGITWLRERKPAVLGVVAAPLLIVSTLALIALFKRIEAGNSDPAQLCFFYVAPSLGASLIATAYACEPAVRKFRSLGWVAIWGGRLSYDMYLFHIALIIAILGQGGAFYGGILGYSAELLAICATVYHFLERPVLAMRPNYDPVVVSPRPPPAIDTRAFVPQFREAFRSSASYGLPAITVIVALIVAMIVVGEQTMVIQFAYALF